MLCLRSAFAISTSGSRLLVVIEDVDEKGKCSTFWDDLQSTSVQATYKDLAAASLIVLLGRGYHATFVSPKSENFTLFKHGERAFDHIILVSPKSKGKKELPKRDSNSLIHKQVLVQRWRPSYS